MKIFNLEDLGATLKSYAKGNTPVDLNKEFLIVAGLLGKKFKGRIKLLGTGEISTPVAVKGIEVSESAKAKIEKAGGSVASGSVPSSKVAVAK